MRSHTWLWLLGSLALGACGDDASSSPDAPAPDAAPDAFVASCVEANVTATLRALPNVTSVTETACGDYVIGEPRCFKIQIWQPNHHGVAESPDFAQHLFLIHRGCAEPTLVADWGYSNDLFYDDELSALYGTNVLWIEHRYQGESVPAPANWDWTALTIENGARDMHRVIDTFRKHYGGRWVSTGASKGGITATYHKYFFKDDLDGSVPYVAPASRARIDPLYQEHLTNTLPAPCAPRIRDAQVASLTTRKTMMLQKVTEVYGATYASIYLEYIINSLDWAFWQYYGVGYCSQVPTAASSDAAFWQFIAFIAGISGPSPAVAPAADPMMSDGALYYEWLTEQGFALQVGAHVEPLLVEPLAKQTMEESFIDQFPLVTLPAYNGTVTAETRRWARDEAEEMLFIYGQYDPWSGAAIDQPVKASSARFFVPQATHGAGISMLSAGERATALTHATRMFGRPPMMQQAAVARRAAEVRQSLVDAKQRRVDSAAVRLRKRVK